MTQKRILYFWFWHARNYFCTDKEIFYCFRIEDYMNLQVYNKPTLSLKVYPLHTANPIPHTKAYIWMSKYSSRSKNLGKQMRFKSVIYINMLKTVWNKNLTDNFYFNCIEVASSNNNWPWLESIFKECHNQVLIFTLMESLFKIKISWKILITWKCHIKELDIKNIVYLLFCW